MRVGFTPTFSIEGCKLDNPPEFGGSVFLDFGVADAVGRRRTERLEIVAESKSLNGLERLHEGISQQTVNPGDTKSGLVLAKSR